DVLKILCDISDSKWLFEVKNFTYLPNILCKASSEVNEILCFLHNSLMYFITNVCNLSNAVSGKFLSILSFIDSDSFLKSVSSVFGIIALISFTILPLSFSTILRQSLYNCSFNSNSSLSIFDQDVVEFSLR